MDKLYVITTREKLDAKDNSSNFLRPFDDEESAIKFIGLVTSNYVEQILGEDATGSVEIQRIFSIDYDGNKTEYEIAFENKSLFLKEKK